jgi:hypothetical protein
MRRFANSTCPIRTDRYPRVLFALVASQLQPIVQQEFSRFLLPQRGQKCNASPFAEDSNDRISPIRRPSVIHLRTSPEI